MNEEWVRRLLDIQPIFSRLWLADCQRDMLFSTSAGLLRLALLGVAHKSCTVVGGNTDFKITS